MLVGPIGVTALNLWAVWKIADSLAWRLLFVWMTCQMPLFFVLSILGMNTLAILTIRLSPWAGFILLSMAAVGDRRARRPRDWPHWLGVFLQFGMNLAMIGKQLWSSWLR
jgi:hypothetical protein